MPLWTVRGAFYARRGYWQPFTKTHEADDAETARHWALSEIGGCHHVKRHQIRIESVSEVSTASP
ncbi:MAG TPA: 50S ribosomal protein L18Ae [Thermoplasmata archaeon]|nr:50S ribosomal protein L18Ae [Thermoplasmata archaeon]